MRVLGRVSGSTDFSVSAEGCQQKRQQIEKGKEFPVNLYERTIKRYAMHRETLTAIVIVPVAAAIVLILTLSLHPAVTSPPSITAVTTDKDLYHSREVMKIAIFLNSSQKMDDTTVRIVGIQDRFGKMRLSHTMPANISSGPAVLTYDYPLPACSSCSGLKNGVYEINVTLVRNGVIISTMTRSVQISK